MDAVVAPRYQGPRNSHSCKDSCFRTTTGSDCAAMPAFSYLMPDNDAPPTVMCTQEELDKDWLSMWKRLGDVAKSCPNVSSKEETIDMWLDSWHSSMVRFCAREYSR